MQGVLAGISRQSLAFVMANVRALCMVSLLPTVLVIILGFIYLAVVGVATIEQEALESGDAFAELLPDIVFRSISTLVWLWLAVKVLRFHMLEEAPSLIGAGGTLRATGAMFVYHVGFFLVLLTLALIVLLMAASVLGAVQSQLAYLVVAAAGAMGILWVGCRLFVGFVPVAVGERPPFFSGWTISEPDHIGLFVRVVAAAAAVTGLLVVLSIIWMTLFGDPLGGLVSGEPEDGAAEAADVTSLNVLGFYVFMQLGSVVVNWYFMVLFSYAYQRLTSRAVVIQ